MKMQRKSNFASILKNICHGWLIATSFFWSNRIEENNTDHLSELSCLGSVLCNITLCNTPIVRWLRSVCIHCANCGEQIMRDRDETGAGCNTMVPIVSHRADQCTTLCNMCTGCTNCAANCDIVHWLCNLYIELQIVQIVPIKWERDVMGAVSDAFEASTNANGRPRCTLNNIHYNAAYSVQCSPMWCSMMMMQ